MATIYTPAQVNAWYQSVQFRDGPQATVASYVSLLNSSSITPSQVQSAIIQDNFTVVNVNPVIRLYQAAINSHAPGCAAAMPWSSCSQVVLLFVYYSVTEIYRSLLFTDKA